jgi:hypothetical protein
MAPTIAALAQREWRRRRRENRRQSCAWCGDVFVPSRFDQAFCGPLCRQQSHRSRKASGETALLRPREAPWQVPEAAPRPAQPRDAAGRMIDIKALVG